MDLFRVGLKFGLYHYTQLPSYKESEMKPSGWTLSNADVLAFLLTLRRKAETSAYAERKKEEKNS